jgi:hypothetical protein
MVRICQGSPPYSENTPNAGNLAAVSPRYSRFMSLTTLHADQQ